jgi:hypothetical protein
MRRVRRGVLAGLAAVGGSALLATIALSASSGGTSKRAPRATAAADQKRQKAGPLRPFRPNRRYFTDGRSGKPIYLTGSHTWWNQGDVSWPVCAHGRPGRFDYDAYLDRVARWGHNFVRLWRVELTRWTECGVVNGVSLQPWARTGPGTAADGLPKFDLTKFEPRYFNSLRARVAAAQRRGIYVGVMLFEGFSPQWFEDAWAGHPFNGGNNVNGVEADIDGNGKGVEFHRYASPRVVALQRAYVREVVDTLNRFDNVIWEIANEAGRGSTSWQYQMIQYIRRYEARKPKQHAVGMTFAAPDGTNEEVLRSPADWISPGGAAYEYTPAVADGRKVSLLDTDHVCQVCGSSQVVWKNFTRGHNVLLMDPLDADPGRVAAREAMALTLRLSRRINLARMRPSTTVCSTGFCLADPGREYLVYQPAGGPFRLYVGERTRTFALEWHDARGTRVVRAGRVRASRGVDLSPPFGGEVVAYLRAS